ncbi:Transcriptional regulator, ArsR family [Methanosarcina horonobensis HB-1 = JCM 15518]|uniref:Transcriptional regulator, ArsR family n=2 Tax=Methanosarcina horonobensis TaxID=418008 RepID=A0A0E3SAU4_9EURY|nr:winged helix-turn-helix domain-containing protein [Methanosarcina horonobensis]AKB77926.1 Transcriptional regulator, ArsR family [Methanosarcina horonobensis HB-1 = JCM 15518]
MKNSSKKENHPESSVLSEEQEMVEVKAIKEKLSEMHSDIKKLMEFTRRLRFEAALESSRKEYSNAILSHLFEDIDTGLERNMIKKCPEKQKCTSAFTALLQQNAELITKNRVDETSISDNRKKLEELRCIAPYSKCEKCFSEVSSLLVKQVNLMRSMRIYADNQEQKPDISALKTAVVMSEILEPVSNPQRLEILRAVAFEMKSFSAFSELTGLRGGNLLFHLQKLMDSGLILQQHERGDYMITEKGFRILQGLNEIYSSLQSSPLQNSSKQDSAENSLQKRQENPELTI